MDAFCPRQVTFYLPGNPAVKVIATEDNGKIYFQVDAQGDADLRAFFFDVADGKEAGLKVTGGGGYLTEYRTGHNAILDLDDGATLAGAVKKGFDVGLEWGTPGTKKDNINFEVTFTLDNNAHNLTLDDIAFQRFGAKLDSVGGSSGGGTQSSKLVALAPAAPNAVNDAYSIFEDGAAGLNSPSKTPHATVFNVLANDTDADNVSTLHVTEIHDGPAHGTVTIAADGKSVSYTPNLDWSGTDTFLYCVQDANGNEDNALVTVTVVAVADDPVITWSVAQGADVNQMLITVTATQNDADGSEFIDSLAAAVAGGLPAGVTITPGAVDPLSTPDHITQVFTVNTPVKTDLDFNIDFTGVSKETSNGDAESETKTQNIKIDYNTATQHGTYNTGDVSEFGPGGAPGWDKFFGINTGNINPTLDGPFGTYAGIEAHLKLGFQSKLEINNGTINVTSDYDVTAETTYNRTTDLLHIGTAALMTDAHFTTVSPTGSFTLDFVYDVLLRAYAGISIDLGIPGTDIDEFSEEINLLKIGPYADVFHILNFNSSTGPSTVTLPSPLDAFSIIQDWPHLDTNGGLTGSDSSNNMITLDLDLDQMISDILFGGANPFDPPKLWAGPFFADADILDVDLTGGINLLQTIALNMGDLVGTLLFEDGSTQSFHIGDALDIANASLIDLNGDHDGLVEFIFSVAPEGSVDNDINVGFNVGVHINALTVEVGYDIGIDSDSTTIGPLATFGVDVPVGPELNLYDSSFDLAFAQQQFAFAA
ncbi:MAG: Ig-like domain-containing protein [Novosphingobium sp.]